MKISKRLKHKSEHTESMLGTTAPTQWFDKGKTQEQWDDKRTKEAKKLKRASKILKAAGL